MPRLFSKVAVLIWLAGAGLAQQPAFDTISVKAVNLAAHPAFGNQGGPGTGEPTRLHLCCVGMFSLLMRAYDVQLDQIVGPGWIMENMGPNLYQVDATMPAGTTKSQYQLMLQKMLADRFHLQIHKETRSFPGYELVVAKDGPKLKEPAPNPNSTLPPGPQMRTSLGRGMIRVQVQQKPLSDLVPGMGRLITQSLGEDPSDFSSHKPRVIDKTGLTGNYDFTLEFACEGCRRFSTNLAYAPPDGASDAAGGALPNIFTALEKQLGLKLVKVKDIALDVLIVDHVEKVPTEN